MGNDINRHLENASSRKIELRQGVGVCGLPGGVPDRPEGHRAGPQLGSGHLVRVGGRAGGARPSVQGTVHALHVVRYPRSMQASRSLPLGQPWAGAGAWCEPPASL